MAYGLANYNIAEISPNFLGGGTKDAEGGVKK
jgi:hypothetical protein